jgi:hypothetical protein
MHLLAWAGRLDPPVTTAKHAAAPVKGQLRHAAHARGDFRYKSGAPLLSFA